MNTVLKTAPLKQPIGLEEAKQHCNIPLGWTEDDTYIKTLIKAATKKAEQFLRRRLITQTWYAYYNAWPSCDSFILPFGKLQTGTAPSVKYTDTDGDQKIWDTDEWNADTATDPGRIVLEYGYSWPTVALHPQNPIVIEFVCGYGLLGSTVEDMILHAIKLIIDDLYNNRGDVIIGVSSSKMMATEGLLWPFRLHEKPTQ